FEFIEVAGVLSGGGERTANTGEGIEIGVGETVVAGDGGRSGIFGVPGAEGPFGSDFALGLGIGQRAVKIERFLIADIFHDEIVDVELERVLACFLRKNDEAGVVADDFAEDDARDRRRLPGWWRGGLRVPRRNGDDHVLDVNAFDMARNVNDAEETEIERETRDLDHGRNVGRMAMAKREALAGDLHARSGFYVEALQLDLAIETGAELADYPTAGAVVDVAGAEKDKEDEAGAEAEENSEE